MSSRRIIVVLALALMVVVAGLPAAASAAQVTSTGCDWLPSGVHADRCVTIDADAGTGDVSRRFGAIRNGKTVAVRILDSNVSDVSLFGTRRSTTVVVTDLDGQPVSGFLAYRNGTTSSDACQGADSCSLLVSYSATNRRSKASLTLSHTDPPVENPPSLPLDHPRFNVPRDTPRYDGRTVLIQADADVAADLGVPLCVAINLAFECVQPDGTTFQVREPGFNDPGGQSARDQVPGGIFFSRTFEPPPPPPPAPGTLPGFDKITQANLDLAIAENTAVCVRNGSFECVRPDGSRFHVTGSFEEPAWVLYPNFIFIL